MRIGTYAEFIAINETEAALMPENISFEEAASIPLVGLTSLQAIRDLAGIRAGQKLLIHAGAGGIGTFAIQLGKILGAKVYTTASQKNFELVRSLGADEIIDYRKEKFQDKAKDMDMVFDTIGGQTLYDSVSIVKRGGHLVSIAHLPDVATVKDFGIKPPLLWIIGLMNSKIQRSARNAGIHYKYIFMHPSGEELEEIAGWIREKKIKPVIDKVFPLAQVREAFTYAEQGHARGKIVLKVR